MKLSDDFASFQEDIGTEPFCQTLGISSTDPWLLELHVDPQDAILEFRRPIGDAKGICFRKDCCVSVRRDECGAWLIMASKVALDELPYWPLHDDRAARQRAQPIVLPFAQASLVKLDARQDGEAVLLSLTLADASTPRAETRMLQLRLGVDFHEVLREQP